MTVERNRIRVTFMIDSLGYGGAEQTLARIVPRMDRERFEPVVAVLQDRDGNPTASTLETSGARVDVVPVRRLRDVTDHVGLVRYLSASRPDVLHTHLEFSHTLGGIYGRTLGIPAVGTVHTFAQGRDSRDGRRLRMMWWSLRNAHRRVIAPSEAGLEHFASVGRISREKLMVMYNGVDLTEFGPRSGTAVRGQLGLDEGQSMIVAVSVLRRAKAIADLISAMARIVEAVPSAHAVIVGDGDDRGRLEALARESGVVESITFAGRRDDVAEIMAAADVFVHPSHEDVLPTVIAEAMGSGMPVVATRVGGIAEMVDHGSTGILYEAGDVDALADACISMFDGRRDSAALGEAARRRAETLFDLDAQVRDLERLYRESSG